MTKITDKSMRTALNAFSKTLDENFCEWSGQDIEKCLRAAIEAYEQSKWHLAKDAPYDTPVLFHTKCGNYVQDFIYDSGVPKLYTHFCHMIPPKEVDND